MATSSIKGITGFIRRNLVSVLFPAFAVFTISADLRHTARWKQQLAQQQEH